MAVHVTLCFQVFTPSMSNENTRCIQNTDNVFLRCTHPKNTLSVFCMYMAYTESGNVNHIRIWFKYYGRGSTIYMRIRIHNILTKEWIFEWTNEQMKYLINEWINEWMIYCLIEYINESMRKYINAILYIITVIRNHPTLPQCGNEGMVHYGLRSRDVKRQWWMRMNKWMNE